MHIVQLATFARTFHGFSRLLVDSCASWCANVVAFGWYIMSNYGTVRRKEGQPRRRDQTALGMDHGGAMQRGKTMVPDWNIPQSERAEMRLLLTVTEAARALGLGRSLVYELVAAGEIASIKIGRARRIPMSALESFVRQRLAAQQEECGAFDRVEVTVERVRSVVQPQRERHVDSSIRRSEIDTSQQPRRGRQRPPDTTRTPGSAATAHGRRKH